MSMNLVLLIIGLLVLIVFLEASGVKVLGGEKGYVGKEGVVFYKGRKQGGGYESVFKKHGLEIGIIVLILAALIFIGSGGLSVIGVQNLNLTESGLITTGIIIVVLLAILFLYFEKSGDGEE